MFRQRLFHPTFSVVEQSNGRGESQGRLEAVVWNEPDHLLGEMNSYYLPHVVEIRFKFMTSIYIPTFYL